MGKPLIFNELKCCGWMLGTIFDTTSSMRREGVVSLHTFLNALSD